MPSLWFRFRLALALGKTYQELTTGKPGMGHCCGYPEEFFWQVFYRLEPFGSEWLQTATIAKAISLPHWPANEDCKIENWLPDCYLKADTWKPEQSQEEIDAFVESRKQMFQRADKQVPNTK